METLNHQVVNGFTKAFIMSGSLSSLSLGKWFGSSGQRKPECRVLHRKLPVCIEAKVSRDFGL